MTAYEVGIKISATDGASSVISKIQQGVGGFQDRMAKFGLASQGLQQFNALAGELMAGVTELDTSTRNIGALGVQNFKELGGTFVELSKTIPNSASEISDAIGEAIGSGVIKTSEDGKVATEEVKTFANIAGKLAVAGAASMGDAVKGVGSVLNAYGLQSKDAERVSTALFNTFNAGSVSVTELSNYLAAVTPIAASVGVSIEQIGGSIATMTKQGMKAPDVMTKIKSFLVELQKPGAALKPIMEQAGVSVDKLKSGEMTLQDATAKLDAAITKAGKGAAEVFSSVESTAVVLSMGGKNAQGAMEDLEAVMKKGTVEAGFKVQAEGIAVKTKLMENAMEAYKIGAIDAMGDVGIGFIGAASMLGSYSSQIMALQGLKAIIPPGTFSAIGTGATAAFGAMKSGAEVAIRGVQSGMTTLKTAMSGLSFSGVASSASGAISTMGQSLSNGVLSLRIFAAEKVKALAASNLFSGGLSGFARTIGGSFVGGVRSAITSILRMNLALFTSPIVWIAAAIAGAAYLIYSNWDKIGAFFEGVFSGVSAAFGAAWSILEEVKAAFQPIIDAVWNLFAPAKATGEAVAGAANNFGWLKDAGIVAGQYIGTAFRVVVTPILWVAKVIGQTIGLMTGLTQSGGNMAKALVGAFTLITIPIRAVIGIMSGLFTFIQSLFNGATLKEAGAALINGLWEGIKATLGKLYDGAMAVVDGIKNIFSGKSSGAEQVKQQAQQQVAKAEIPAPKVETPKVPDIAAPKVGTPKVPKAETPKLRPLNPPETPDFSWIAKQNIKPPKIEPMKAPEIQTPSGTPASAGKGGSWLQDIIKQAESFDVNSIPGADKVKETVDGIVSGVPNLTDVVGGLVPELPDFAGIVENSMPEMPDFAEMASGIKPELPDVSGIAGGISLENLGISSIGGVSSLGLPSLPSSVQELLKTAGIDLPKTGGKDEQSKPVKAAVKSESGGFTVNFTVNVNGDGAISQGADNIRRQVEGVLRDQAPELLLQIERAMNQSKRKMFDTL